MNVDPKTLRPVRTGVLIRRDPADERTASGLYIPDKAKDKPVRGEVLAIGPGRTSEHGAMVPVSVKPGDVVYFRPYGQVVIGDERDRLVIVDDADCFAAIARSCACAT